MTDIYPNQPGAKGQGHTRDTSAAAANAIAPSVAGLRMIALHTLATMGAATAEEVAACAWATRAAIAPRLSELRRMGLIAPTGQRRLNPSGKSACVWALTETGRIGLPGWVISKAAERRQGGGAI